MQFTTSTTIEAPPETVWAILTDLAAWPSWNSTVTATEGSVALGQKVTVSVTANPGRSFPVTVSALDAPARMVWTGGMPLGLFTGTRTYSLDRDERRTQFAMDEVYAGPLAPMLTRSIPDLQPSFEEFAACLKAHAEANARSAS
jgi:hypothetical protein